MATIGDVTEIIRMIIRAINAFETPQKLNTDCLEFIEFLRCASKILEQLQGIPLSDAAMETLINMEDVLRKAYDIIYTSQNHSFLYLMFNGSSIQKQIKGAYEMLGNYLNLIQANQVGETFQFLERTRILLQEPHKSAREKNEVSDALSNSGRIGNGQIAVTNRDEIGNNDVSLRIFDFKELRVATMNFRHDNLIGNGGFGYVYKGLVKNNRGFGIFTVAIKKSRAVGPGEEEAWKAEVKYLGRIVHPNVIKLLGYCKIKEKEVTWLGFHRKEVKNFCLVYEYMANGSLMDHLIPGSQDFEPLSWAQRIKIATGSARALAFLHESHIIHRDVKTRNFLLDSNFNSKLSDFGLAIDSPTDRNSYTEECICGTWGFIAPEYLMTGRLNEKIDVYGFGATLLEILSGQRLFDFLRKFETMYQELGLQTLSTIQHIPEDILSRATLLEVVSGDRGRKIDGAGNWSSQEFGISLQSPEDSSTNQYIDRPLQKLIISSTSGLRNLDNLIDPRLDGKYPLEAARLAVQLVLSCIAYDPNNRPLMEEVVKVLEHIQTIKMPSATSAPSRIDSDPCDPLPYDIDFLASSSMVYEPAPFDADAELSCSVPRSMMMSEPAPYDADAEFSFLLSKSMSVSEPAPFDAETELSFPKFKVSHSPISIEA